MTGSQDDAAEQIDTSEGMHTRNHMMMDEVNDLVRKLDARIEELRKERDEATKCRELSETAVDNYRGTIAAWRYVHRMSVQCEPCCPCGLRAFAPALAQVGDTEGHVVFWCTDHGHWVGDETEVLWKLKDDVPVWSDNILVRWESHDGWREGVLVCCVVGDEGHAWWSTEMEAALKLDGLAIIWDRHRNERCIVPLSNVRLVERPAYEGTYDNAIDPEMYM